MHLQYINLVINRSQKKYLLNLRKLIYALSGITAMIFLLLLVPFLNLPQNSVVYFEDDQIEISYTETLCDDIKNGVSFEYYLIKVKNKTNETLVVNFYLGEEVNKTEENKVAFVLNPFEIKMGNCNYQTVDLKLFKRENKTKKSTVTEVFKLNSIETIEVY